MRCLEKKKKIENFMLKIIFSVCAHFKTKKGTNMQSVGFKTLENLLLNVANPIFPSYFIKKWQLKENGTLHIKISKNLGNLVIKGLPLNFAGVVSSVNSGSQLLGYLLISSARSHCKWYIRFWANGHRNHQSIVHSLYPVPFRIVHSLQILCLSC